MSNTCAIILNYFGAESTEKCLASLAGQGLKKIFLVDNSASPEELERLRRVVDRVTDIDQEWKIVLIANKENFGFGRAINSVLKSINRAAENYEYYLLINNDAEAMPGMHASLIDAIEKNNEIVITAPFVLSKNSSSCFLWYNRITGALTSRKIPFSFPYLVGHCLLIRASYLANRLPFDEGFFMYGEDVLLGWQVIRDGKTSLCVGDAGVKHLGTGSSKKGDLFYEYHLARGHVLLAHKTARNRLELFLYLAGRVLYLSARAMVRCTRYRSFSPMTAFLLAWTNRDVPAPMPEQ